MYNLKVNEDVEDYIYEILDYTLQYHMIFYRVFNKSLSTIDDLEYIINGSVAKLEKYS